MIIYRPHCGGTIYEAVINAIEFNNEQEMKEYISDIWGELLSEEDIVIDKYSFDDDRIGWRDTRYVCSNRFGDSDNLAIFGYPQCIGYCATDYDKL